jgi:DNA polymerase-1
MDTSAILGFTNSLLDVIKREKPDHLAVCFDRGGSAARTEAFPEYKANRQETPEAIKIAVPIIESILKAMKIPAVVLAGYEADDIIGTLAKKAEKEGYQTFMVTPDKDFAQLQKYNNVSQFSPMTKKYIRVEHPRKQLLELILKGDTSDGVPNVLSGDNVFVDGVRQTPLRKPILEALMEDPTSQGQDVFRNIQRNRKLIDLESTPADLKQDIINTFNSQDKKENSKKVFQYLVDKRCRRLLEDVKEFI